MLRGKCPPTEKRASLSITLPVSPVTTALQLCGPIHYEETTATDLDERSGTDVRIAVYC